MKIQTLKEQKGFTIVELLIVIVVIGILAAITIVAFNGIQNRANKTAAEGLATDLIKKAEAYNAIEGAYPTPSQLTATTIKEAELDTKLETAVENTTALSASNGKTAVTYTNCSSGGIQIVYWDFVAKAVSAPKTAGDVTTCS